MRPEVETAYLESIAGLTFALNEITDYVQEAIDITTESQKISKSLGRSFSLASAELKPAIDNLNGTIAQKLSVAFAGLEKGLNLNTTEVIGLATEQKILGQEYKKTIALFADLQKSFNFSTVQSNELSKVLKNTSTQFGVSVEFLVDSLDSFLQKNKDILTITDLTQPAVEAVTMLRGMFGEGSSNQKDLESFIGLLLSSGTTAIKEISTLGITQERRLLGTAKTSEEFINIVVSALNKSYSRVRDVLDRQGDAGDVLTNKSLIISNLFEQAGGSVLRLGNQLDDIIPAFEKAKNDTLDFGQQLSQAFDPFKTAFLTIIDAGSDTLTTFFGLIKEAGDSVKTFIDNNLKNLTATKVATAALVALAAAATQAKLALNVRTAIDLKNKARIDNAPLIGPPAPPLNTMEEMKLGIKTLLDPLKSFKNFLSQLPKMGFIGGLKAIVAPLAGAFKALVLPLIKISAIFVALGTIVAGFVSSIQEGLDLGPLFKGIVAVGKLLFKGLFGIGKFLGELASVILGPVVWGLNKLGELLSGFASLFGIGSADTTDKIKTEIVEGNKVDLLTQIAANTASTATGVADLKTGPTGPAATRTLIDPSEVATTFREKAIMEAAERILDASKVEVLIAKGVRMRDPDTGAMIDTPDARRSLDKVVEKLGGLEKVLERLDSHAIQQLLEQNKLVDVMKSADYTLKTSTKLEEIQVMVETTTKEVLDSGYGG